MSKEPRPGQNIRFVPLSYNSADSQPSALAIIHAIFPEWKYSPGEIALVKLTQGITNTLFKITKKHGDAGSETAVLLRAYGSGTGILIDREKEIFVHSLLAQHNLASTLHARFQNGLVYEFVPGKVCSPADITREPVWRGVARRMGHWHAVLPTAAFYHRGENDASKAETVPNITPGKPSPNIWTLMQNWVLALPGQTDEEKARKTKLQTELERLVRELGNTPGLGRDGLVFAHNDLLAGNIVVQPPAVDGVETVNFIDYEHAIPAPAAFDIVSHFAEWAGFECDYSLLPTRSIRREFLREYVKSYNLQLKRSNEDPDQLDRLCEEVDSFRAVPSFFWGVCSLIQATISEFDFNHAKYAETRLAEYWARRDEADGSREKAGREMPLRERRWAQEG